MIRQCDYAMVSKNAEVYEINVADYMDLASDKELKAFMTYNEENNYELPGEHLERQKAVTLAKIFYSAATEAK